MIIPEGGGGGPSAVACDVALLMMTNITCRSCSMPHTSLLYNMQRFSFKVQVERKLTQKGSKKYFDASNTYHFYSLHQRFSLLWICIFKITMTTADWWVRWNDEDRCPKFANLIGSPIYRIASVHLHSSQYTFISSSFLSSHLCHVVAFLQYVLSRILS